MTLPNFPTIDEVLTDIRRKAVGRSRYEGQAPYPDEMLLHEVERLNALLDQMVSQALDMAEDLGDRDVIMNEDVHEVNCVLRVEVEALNDDANDLHTEIAALNDDLDAANTLIDRLKGEIMDLKFGKRDAVDL